MLVTQLINLKGNPAANQFVLIHNDGTKVFQSYETKIAEISPDGKITLDNKALEYSRTTSKHLYIFLNMDKAGILKRIESKEISLIDLN